MTTLTKVQRLEAELEAARAEETKQASKDDFEGLVVKFNELGASINAMLQSRTSTDEKSLVSTLLENVVHDHIFRQTNPTSASDRIPLPKESAFGVLLDIDDVQVDQKPAKKDVQDNPVTLDMDLLRLTSTFTAEVLTSSGSA